MLALRTRELEKLLGFNTIFIIHFSTDANLKKITIISNASMHACFSMKNLVMRMLGRRLKKTIPPSIVCSLSSHQNWWSQHPPLVIHSGEVAEAFDPSQCLPRIRVCDKKKIAYKINTFVIMNTLSQHWLWNTNPLYNKAISKMKKMTENLNNWKCQTFILFPNLMNIQNNSSEWKKYWFSFFSFFITNLLK